MICVLLLSMLSQCTAVQMTKPVVLAPGSGYGDHLHSTVHPPSRSINKIRNQTHLVQKKKSLHKKAPNFHQNHKHGYSAAVRADGKWENAQGSFAPEFRKIANQMHWSPKDPAFRKIAAGMHWKTDEPTAVFNCNWPTVVSTTVPFEDLSPEDLKNPGLDHDRENHRYKIGYLPGDNQDPNENCAPIKCNHPYLLGHNMHGDGSDSLDSTYTCGSFHWNDEKKAIVMQVSVDCLLVDVFERAPEDMQDDIVEKLNHMGYASTDDIPKLEVLPIHLKNGEGTEYSYSINPELKDATCHALPAEIKALACRPSGYGVLFIVFFLTYLGLQ